ncbi:MAG: FAD-dependent oxidoreductase, partial [Actinomycetota bacterium]
MTSFDVAVIGGGVHGASAAFHLAGRGVRTVVIEKTAPAGGPTGRSSAICRAYYTNAFLASVARDSIAMFRTFEEHTGRESGFRETGLLVLHPAEDEATVREVVPRLSEQGIPTDLLTPDQVLDKWPMFDLTGIAIAAFEHDAGYADPVLTTSGLLERARELGAEVRIGRDVTRIKPDGTAWRLTTDDGTAIGAERVLIAAGPWTRPLAMQLDVLVDRGQR